MLPSEALFVTPCCTIPRSRSGGDSESVARQVDRVHASGFLRFGSSPLTLHPARCIPLYIGDGRKSVVQEARPLPATQVRLRRPRSLLRSAR